MSSIEQIHAQLEVLHEVLEKQTAAEKKQQPSAHFGLRYNELRAQAMHVINDHDAAHWPPELNVRPAQEVGPKITYATYSEIRVYAAQIAVLLAQRIEPDAPMMG